MSKTLYNGTPVEIVDSLRSLYPLKDFEEEAIIEVVAEFRELREKATAKKPVYSNFDENGEVDENGKEVIIPYKAVCPACGYEFEFGTWNDEQNHHCECGQRMLWGDWSEGKE